jgi:hypothetical protein
MGINEKDIKKLWGLSAGRCSYPSCNQECITFVDSDLIVLGEMAHVIAKSPTGPRGVPTGGEDTYENLVLLCPTHHAEVDKAPAGVYPREVILRWKKVHEAGVAAALRSPVFNTRTELCAYIKHRLVENKTLWAAYGPESAAARKNPYSNLYRLWQFRKLSTIVPNNRKIIDAIQRNSHFFDGSQYEIARSFVEHAEGFEQSSYERLEDIPRFPTTFEEVINECSKAE